MKYCSAIFLVSVISYSCSNDELAPSQNSMEVRDLSNLSSDAPAKLPEVTKNLGERLIKDIPYDISRAVDPSECDDTAFDAAISESVSSNLDELGAEWYSNYAEMNFYHTITDESVPYFGENGEYTNFVKKITRNLESFWDMENEISVRGQHNTTLDDKDKIVDILTFWYEFPLETAQVYADYFVDYINVESTFLTETPLLSFDGFAIALDGILDQYDLIVIGDGIIQVSEEAGVDSKVSYAGILAHEWGHHCQFNADWTYGSVDPENGAESTRATELEADYFTAYFLTHKRGGTYNWKGVEGFLDLFFNIGDCGFESDGHHGTPAQRMAAAKAGSDLANAAQKKGKILSPDEVHEAFLNDLNSKILGDIIVATSN